MLDDAAAVWSGVAVVGLVALWFSAVAVPATPPVVPAAEALPVPVEHWSARCFTSVTLKVLVEPVAEGDEVELAEACWPAIIEPVS